MTDRAELRVLVVDDEPLARDRLVEAVSTRPGFVVAGACRDGQEAVLAIEQDPPDLVLLDIQMPGLDGLGVVESVGPERMPPVVFVSAHGEYALRAFEVAALDYLTKPWDLDRLGQALERARSRVEARDGAALAERLADLLAVHGAGPARIPVRSRGRVVLLERERIDSVSGAGNYLRVHADGEEHLVRASLEEFGRRLGAGFQRIHRSHLVRLGAVREVVPDGKGARIRLRDGAELPVGASHLAGLWEALGRT